MHTHVSHHNHMITVVKNGRLNPDVRLWTGIAALSVAVLTAAEFLVQVLVVGARPPLDDQAALSAFMTRTANGTLVTILIDTFLMSALTSSRGSSPRPDRMHLPERRSTTRSATTFSRRGRGGRRCLRVCRTVTLEQAPGAS